VSDAGAVAAAYGSVSAVTFVAAASYLESQGITYGGHVVAVMALMEAPAIHTPHQCAVLSIMRLPTAAF